MVYVFMPPSSCSKNPAFVCYRLAVDGDGDGGFSFRPALLVVLFAVGRTKGVRCSANKSKLP